MRTRESLCIHNLCICRDLQSYGCLRILRLRCTFYFTKKCPFTFAKKCTSKVTYYNHLIHHAYIGLDDAHDLSGNVFVDEVGDRDAREAVADEGDVLESPVLFFFLTVCHTVNVYLLHLYYDPCFLFSAAIGRTFFKKAAAFVGR